MEFWGTLAFSGVVGFVRMVSVIACIYAACMVGHQFKNHPALAGILSFFVMQYVQGWLEKLLQIGTGVYETAIYSAVGDGQHRDCRLGSGLHGKRDGHAGHRGGIRCLLVRADGLADAKQTQPRVMKREKSDGKF